MFGLEKKFDQWLKKKELQWIHEISDPAIPKIKEAMNTFDPNWYNKYSKFTYYEAGDDKEKLSFIVDFTHPLTHVYGKFVSHLIYGKEVSELAYENMEKAWLMALGEACHKNAGIVSSISAKVGGYVSWRNQELGLKYLMKRELPNVYIVGGYIIRHEEPYFNEMIETIEKHGIEANEKTKMCHLEALKLERTMREHPYILRNFPSVKLIDVLTFAYRGNQVVANIVNNRVESFINEFGND